MLADAGEDPLVFDGGGRGRLRDALTLEAAERLADELQQSGFTVEATWTDPAGDFLLTLARPAAGR